MSDTVRKELEIRLKTIAIAADKARLQASAGDMCNIIYHLNQIKQYEQSARIDCEYLKDKKV